MRMIGGAILFVGAVQLLSLCSSHSRHLTPDMDLEPGTFFLVALVIGAFALFLVIDGAVAEYRNPPWRRLDPP
jgi:hypothetical protein